MQCLFLCQVNEMFTLMYTLPFHYISMTFFRSVLKFNKKILELDFFWIFSTHSHCVFKWSFEMTTTPKLSLMYRIFLSSEFWARQAQREAVKIKNLDFSYWAWSTPWRHVLSLKKFCRNPALSWAIRYSVFQPVKFTSSFEFVCGTLFSTFWRLILKFGYIKWF